MDDKLLTYCDNPIYAHEIVQMLEDNHIEATIVDTQIPASFGATGGVYANCAIYVKKQDYEKSRLLLYALDKSRTFSD